MTHIPLASQGSTLPASPALKPVNGTPFRAAAIRADPQHQGSAPNTAPGEAGEDTRVRGSKITEAIAASGGTLPRRPALKAGERLAAPRLPVRATPTASGSQRRTPGRSRRKTLRVRAARLEAIAASGMQLQDPPLKPADALRAQAATTGQPTASGCQRPTPRQAQSRRRHRVRRGKIKLNRGIRDAASNTHRAKASGQRSRPGYRMTNNPQHRGCQRPTPRRGQSRRKDTSCPARQD